MNLATPLFSLFRFLVVPSVLFTTFLYLYPAVLNCNFPLVQETESHCVLNSSASAAYASSTTARAPFRLLVLADPQLEGDSSLVPPEAPLFPSLVAFERRRDAEALLDSYLALFKDVISRDIPGLIDRIRKPLDLFGNDYYLAHVYRTMHWWTEPTHVTVLGDLIGSQWVSNEEFDARAWRFWNRVFWGASKVPEHYMNSAGLNRYAIGQDPHWDRYLINIAGNHDIGYAGDINEERMQRFTREYGQPNYDLLFYLNQTSELQSGAAELRGSDPELRLLVLNSMNLDGPVWKQELQQGTYDFINHQIIENSKSVEDRTRLTILLTHIPLRKAEGLCVDGPFFKYHDLGLAEQNHLGEEATRSILEGIFGMSTDEHAPVGGKGRPGIILNGHDHEGCDTYHHASHAEDGEQRTWMATPSMKVKDDYADMPGIREITMRSMMGSYGGFAGMLSVWFDEERNEWKHDFSVCMLSIQHIWWAIHVLDLLTTTVLILATVCKAIERRHMSNTISRSLASSKGTGQEQREARSKIKA